MVAKGHWAVGGGAVVLCAVQTHLHPPSATVACRAPCRSRAQARTPCAPLREAHTHALKFLKKLDFTNACPLQ